MTWPKWKNVGLFYVLSPPLQREQKYEKEISTKFIYLFSIKGTIKLKTTTAWLHPVCLFFFIYLDDKSFFFLRKLKKEKAGKSKVTLQSLGFQVALIHVPELGMLASLSQQGYVVDGLLKERN